MRVLLNHSHEILMTKAIFDQSNYICILIIMMMKGSNK